MKVKVYHNGDDVYIAWKPNRSSRSVITTGNFLRAMRFKI